MKVTQEKLPASQIGLEIEIPAETTKQVYEKIVQKLARSIRIPGFRQGKVPRHILLQRLGAQRIKAEALEELIQESLKKAIEQESIDAIGNYQLKSSIDDLLETYEPGKALAFSASVDVPPVVELGEYQGLQVKAEQIEYDPAQVDETLEKQRQAQATLVPVEDRPVQMGDIAVVDYEGRFTEAEGDEAEVIEGTQATDFQMEIEAGKFVEGLIEGIVGMNPGESKEVEVQFPEDYPREDLAGKAVTFSVTLKELKEKELPELDDEFAEDASEFETMAELRESLESQYKERAEQETQDGIEAALVEALVEVATIDPPETNIEQELDTILTQTAMQMQQYGIDVSALFNKDNIPQMREQSRPEAIQKLQESLALLEVAKRESLEPNEEEIEAEMKSVMEELSGQKYDLERLRSYITDDLSKKNALEWLQDKATVELVPAGTLNPEEDEETDSTSDATSNAIDVEAEAVGEEE
ncbi:trigger factor [Lusitaniella coriacea]|uniref:trigger factor n=1 Tax=Lusitaniella coriacea TaxID=1983105 RepID=UPI003CFAD672